MKISIVTSYYNRKSQFINTIETIKHSKQIDNTELIVVDDCSSPEHRLEDILEKYPFIKLIRLESKDRWYTNPCVPFNKGIKESSGDIIVMQNPECLHVGDILSDLVNKIDDDKYITQAVYSLDKFNTEKISKLDYNDSNVFDKIKNEILPMNNSTYIAEGKDCWYNHSKYRAASYHFLGAITKNNMNKLNGFDERYSNGIGYDDDELLFRIKLLGLNIQIHDDPFAIHQWHYSENNFFAKSPDIGAAISKNNNLFINVTSKLTNPFVNNDINN
jgi:hypothetical protein